MTIDLRKFAEDCQSYGEALGRIRERNRIAELIRLSLVVEPAVLSWLVETINRAPIPNLPAPLMPEERK